MGLTEFSLFSQIRYSIFSVFVKFFKGFIFSIYAYLEEAGIYTVSVEDYNTYFETGESFGSSLYEYTLYLEDWSRHTSEPDDVDSPSVELEIDQSNSWTSVGSLIQEEGDVDHISIDYNVESTHFYISKYANKD